MATENSTGDKPVSYAGTLLRDFCGDTDVDSTSSLSSLVPVFQAVLERERAQQLHFVERNDRAVQWLQAQTLNDDNNVASLNYETSATHFQATLQHVLSETDFVACREVLANNDNNRQRR